MRVHVQLTAREGCVWCNGTGLDRRPGSRDVNLCSCIEAGQARPDILVRHSYNPIRRMDLVDWDALADAAGSIR